MRTTILSLILIFSLAGCGGDDDDAPAPAAAPSETVAEVDGVDLSGSYRLAGVECYNNLSGELSHTGTITDISNTVTIQGNSYTEITSDADCAETTTGRILFRQDGNFTLSSIAVSVPGGRCEISGNLSLLPADGVGILSVRPFSYTAESGAAVRAVTGRYITNPASADIGVTSLNEITFPPESRCFAVYSRM